MHHHCVTFFSIVLHINANFQIYVHVFRKNNYKWLPVKPLIKIDYCQILMGYLWLTLLSFEENIPTNIFEGYIEYSFATF